jgi:hypothetical protein
MAESLRIVTRFGDLIKNIPSDDEKLVADVSTPHLLIFDVMMGGKAIESIVDR